MPNRELPREGTAGKRNLEERPGPDVLRKSSEAKKARATADHSSPHGEGSNTDNTKQKATKAGKATANRITALENSALKLLSQLSPTTRAEIPGANDFMEEMQKTERMNSQLTRIENNFARFIKTNGIIDTPGETRYGDFSHDMKLRQPSEKATSNSPQPPENDQQTAIYKDKIPGLNW